MNNKTIRLSAVVIARNEESRIATCLESLSFCDEIIVIDNGSTDKTLEIAKKFYAIIHHVKGIDFSTLRNVGKEKAEGEWILYVDADEVVTEKLKEEINRVTSYAVPAGRQELRVKNRKESPSISAYYIKRCNYYLGYKWPVQDKMQRLFFKDKLIRWEGTIHETALIDGEMGELHEPLIHNTHRTLFEMVDKTNEWSQFEAQLRFDTHHKRVVWWRLLRVMGTGFYKSFIKEGGWKAGTVGWIESIYQAFSMFITYAKLWEMQEEDIRDKI
jgi:glycosyltransferase involved in cell wall biosynthesis